MTAEAGGAARPARADLGLGVLAAAVIVRLWIMPLRSSLWLDEFGTTWVTGGRFAEIPARARLFPQSIPYASLVWVARSLTGSSEASRSRIRRTVLAAVSLSSRA